MGKDYTKLTKQEQDELLERVYDTAMRYESTYGCCPQCVLGPMYEVFGIGDENVFKACYGFGAGTGMTSLSSCGALAASVLFIGMSCGRTFGNIDQGRAEKCYALSKKALEYFKERYGGYLCKDVQTCKMGRSFDLNVPKENQAFVDAGGHVDKCTAVCGETCQYLAKLLFSGELS